MLKRSSIDFILSTEDNSIGPPQGSWMFSGIVVSCDSGINIRTDCYNWIGSNDSSTVEKAKLTFLCFVRAG